MVLSDIAIRRPVFTVMVMAALMTLGLIAMFELGVDLFPDVSIPVISVTTIYPGAGPEEVEQQVTKRVEDAVSAVNGVDTVMSYSRDSVSTVIVRFKLSADIKSANSDVRDKVAAIRGEFPQDVKDPIIARFDPTATAILTYAVSSNRGPAQTRRLAKDVVKPQLEAIDGVASVTITGGLEREIHVFVEPDKLDALGLSLAQIAQQLGEEGYDLPAGRITSATQEISVKTLGRFRSIDALKNLVVATSESGGQVRLSDVAHVVDGFKEVRTTTRVDGRDAVTLTIQKQGGSNTVAVADQVYAKVQDLGRVLPRDVKLKKVIDESTFIRRNIHDVRRDLVFGGLMAVLVIFLFMLDWRSTLISSLSLPTSVVTTFFVMWAMHFTINMLTMIGLSLSIGLLIDDAVVVRENIFRHMELGKDPVTAAKEATNEIGLAVMATTFTIVAVFVPVAFMGGIVGQFFRQFGLTVAAAVLVSLFVSFTLDPMMSARVMKAIQPGHHEELKRHRFFGPVVRSYDRLDELYRSLLAWALRHKATVVMTALALFAGTLGLVPFMGKEFMTPEDRGEFKVELEMPPDTSFAAMSRTVARVEKLVRSANQNVLSIFSVVGPDEEANKAELRVYCTKVDERRPLTQWDIEEDIRRKLRDVPGLRAEVQDLGIVEGANESPVTLYVRGENYDTLRLLARQALRAVRTTRGAVDADESYRPGKPQASVAVDRAAAADLGVSVGTVAQTLRLALEGAVVAKYRDQGRDFDVRVQLAPTDRTSVAELADLEVPATGRRLGGSASPLMMLQAMSGPRLVRIGQIARVNKGSGPSTIERQDRERQIVVTADLNGRPLGDVVNDIQAKLAKIGKPAGYSFVWGSETKRMNETFLNMGIALAVAVLFIFFVLASQFESFIHPLTIMLALPLALVGALLLLFLTGNALSMSSMIGIILLMGLVTKNAILLVDYTNELRGQGLSMLAALLKAGPTRLRPILMTSAAMVLGMLPAALARGEGSEFKSAMAIAVIGGVIASTFLTLIVVPVAYTWFDRLSFKHDFSTHEGPTGAASPAGGDPTGRIAAPALVIDSAAEER